MNTRRGAEEANRESHENGQATDIREMKDRLRRIETRLVKFMDQQGFDTERKLPDFHTRPLRNERVGIVEVPSTMVSIEDIAKAIPEDWDPMLQVRVMHKGELVCYVYKKEVRDGGSQ